METMEKSKCNNKDDLYIVGYMLRSDITNERINDVE